MLAFPGIAERVNRTLSVVGGAAGLKMLRTAALSRGINHFNCLKNGPSPDPVVTGLDCAATDQMDIPTEHLTQLLLHADMVEKSPIGCGEEAYQCVDIVLRPKVIPQDGTEE